MSGRTIPLSPQQRQLWRLQRQTGGEAFRSRCEVHVEGPLDSARLRLALEACAAQHEVLSCVFRQGPSGDPSAEVIPGGGRPTWRDGMAWNGRPDPDGGLEADLRSLDAGRHLLQLDVSSLRADARGLECLVLETARAYEALALGVAAPEVPVSFGVLAQWQNQLLETEEASLGKRFWSRQDLSTLMARLPWERAPQPGQPFAPRSEPVALPTELPVRLAASGLGAPPEEILQACWQVLLWRLTEAAEVVVGTTFNGRAYEEVERVVGPFAKDLPVHLRLDEKMSFAAVLRQLGDAVAEAREWQEYFTWDQFQHIVADEGSLFFPFGFELRSVQPPFEAGGLRFRFTKAAGCHDRFRVRLRGVVHGGSVELELLYDAAVLDEAEARRLAGQLASLAGAAIAEPERKIGDLPLVGTAERRLLEGLAGRPAPSASSGALHLAIEGQAAVAPERTAVVAGDAELTYGELNARANQLARHLRSLGVTPGDLVGAWLDRTVEMPMTILGILKAGAAYLPLDPAYPEERLAFMVRESRVPWVLAAGEASPGFRVADGLGLVSLARDAAAVARQSREDLGVCVEPGSPAYVMYTSGSTGEPRGVIVPHGCVAHYVQALQDRLELQPGDRYLHTASVAFSSSVRQLMVPLSHGATVVVATAEQKADPEALFCEIRDRGVTVADLVPSHWHGCLRSLQALDPGTREALLANRLRLLLSASEPLPSDLAAAWSAILGGRGRFVNMFGQTETTGIVATHPVSPEVDGAVGVVPVGRALPGMALYLLDRRGRDLAPLGVAGEICAAGPGVGLGYLGRPAETAERFVPDRFSGIPGGRLYRTGDLGRLRPDGTVEFLGRRDHQIKVRGFRVEPGEVEAALRRHGAVREAAVALHREEASGSEWLVAYLVADEGLPEPHELRSLLGRTLPEHMVPSFFVPLAALPLTPTGKLDRKALPAPVRATATGAAPLDPLERRLAEVWQEMLGVARVEAHDNFYKLGGHSLLALKLISRIREELEVELPFRTVFRSPTLAGLAAEIRSLKEAVLPVADSPLGRIERTEPERLLADLDRISDEQVSTLLARMLDQGEGST